LFQNAAMSKHPDPPASRNALSFRLGRWAEARASGWGIAALVLLAGLATAVALTGSGVLLR
jgi:hypothetical protein